MQSLLVNPRHFNFSSMFVLVFEKNVIKDVSRFNAKQKSFIQQKIQILKNNPFPGGKNPKKLKEVDAFRLRIGDYRVLYKIQNTEVRIFAILHRKDAYKDI